MDLPDRMIDCHVHIVAWDRAARAFVDRSGIAQFWVMCVARSKATNDIGYEAARDMPGRIIPFAHLRWNEWAADPNEVERAYEKGAVGIKAIRPPLPYDHPSYFPIYERADKLHMPILFHTGIIAHMPYDSQRLHELSFGPTNMQPAMLGGIAAAFPELPIIGGHLGYPYTEQTHQNLYYYPNIVHDICGYVPFEWLIAHLDDRTGPHRGPEFFYEKIVHASDVFLGRGSYKHASERYEAWVHFFRHVGRTYAWGQHADQVLFENAERIMDAVLEQQERT